jgi:hypothetical protein
MSFFILSTIVLNGQASGHATYSLYQEGLSQIQISKLNEDRSGRIWVGTMDGVCIFSPESQTFESPLTNPMLKLGSVKEIEQDREGKTWFASIRGLFSEDGDSVMLPGFEGSTSGVRFCFDANNYLWYVHRERGRVYCVVNDRHHALDSLLPDLQGCPFAEVHYHETSKRIFLSTKDGGYYFLNIEKRCAEKLEVDSLEMVKVSHHDEIYTFSQKGMFRIGPDGRKNWVMDLPREDWKQIQCLDIGLDGRCFFSREAFIFEARDGKRYDYGKQFKSVTDVLISKNGSTYAGTWEGLKVFHASSLRFWDERDGVKNPWTVLRDGWGTLWYQGFGQGLYRFDSVAGRFLEDTTYFDQFMIRDRTREMKYDHYPGSKVDRNGNLLLAHGNGILTREGKVFRFLNSSNKCADFTALDILEDTARRRILAASNDIVELDDHGNCRTLTKGRNALNGIYLLDLEIGPHGRVWTATSDQLGYLDGDSLVKYSDIGSFPIHFDQKRLLWAAGKWGEGLLAIEPDIGRSWPVAPAFLKRFLSFIDQIGDTYLLIGVVDGLFLIRLDEYYRSGKVFMAHFNHHNGLIGQECAQNSLFRDKNGVFYFPTESAIISIEPSQLKKELGYPYDTTSIVVVKAEEMSTGTALKEGGEDPPSFRFDHNTFKFQFSSTGSASFVLKFTLTRLGSPEHVQSKGLSNNGEIQLTGLPKGKYRLSVVPNLGSQKLMLAKEMHWEFEVMGSLDFWIGVMAWATPFLVLLIGIFIWIRRDYLKNRITKRDRELFSLQLARLANSADNQNYINLLSTFEIMEVGSNRLGEKELQNFYTLLRDQGKVFQDSNTFWTLKQEIHFTRSFVKLSKLAEDFHFEMEVPEEVTEILETTLFPKALLQSLVEKGHRYAIKSRPKGEASIRVEFELRPDQFVIEITDNGLGMDNSSRLSQQVTKKGHGLIVGLFAILNKYPPKNRFSFTLSDRYEQKALAGVTCRITLPIHFNYPNTE